MAQSSQPGSSPYVLAFVGENEHGILAWWTRRILAALSPYGLSYKLLDLTDAAWRTRLSDTLVAGKPTFCFSFQGFGINLNLNGGNYWSQLQVPFLSYMGDSPYHAPGLHAAEGPGLYLLYGCADFLEVYRDHLGGRAYASILPYGYPENPHADEAPWAEREHKVVYVKTAVDPGKLRGAWADLPGPVRALLQESADHVLTGTDMTVAAVCAAAFERHYVHCGNQRELFLFVCSTVDRYVRAVRAERMVRALLPHDALIVGDWSYLDGAQARARFHAPVGAAALDALYARSQVVVSTSPSVRYGMHERIMAGLFAKSAVVSDRTPFLERLLAGCPSFQGLDIDGDAFAEQLGSTLRAALADAAMPDKLAQSVEVARARFSFDGFIQGLLEQLQVEVHRRNIEGGWCFPPVECRQASLPAAA